MINRLMGSLDGLQLGCHLHHRTELYKMHFLYCSISEITSHIMVNPGDNAEIICVVDANPINADSIKWTRDGFDMEARTRLANVSTNFYLTVVNVTAEDAGEFTCEVNNGVGESVKNSTFLLVRRKYNSECNDLGK
jgi:hypothetical protein